MKPTIAKSISVEEALGRIKRGLVDRSQKEWVVSATKVQPLVG